MNDDERREYQREYNRRWREVNREYKREQDRLYRLANQERARAYREANRERAREYNRAYYKATYPERLEYNATTKHGITRVIRDWMYESQDRACAGCKKPMPDADLEVDHDHDCCPSGWSCGRCVRGLLCHRCNKRDALASVFAARFG